MLNRQRFLTHPVFSEARRRFLNECDNQSIKASEKYDEPLNPDSWTFEELAQHSTQEVVDLGRYTETMRMKGEKAEKLLWWIYNTMKDAPAIDHEEVMVEVERAILDHFAKPLMKGGE